MNQQIKKELERIVDGAGVKVSDLETSAEANRRIKLETARGVYELPANRFLIFLQKLPDRIGVEALRQAIEERFPSVMERS